MAAPLAHVDAAAHGAAPSLGAARRADMPSGVGRRRLGPNSNESGARDSRRPHLEPLPPRPRTAVLQLVESLDERGRWLTPLEQLSNPYRGPGSAEPYRDSTYASLFVGDHTDTSPYPASDGAAAYGAASEQAPLGISVSRYQRLIGSVARG